MDTKLIDEDFVAAAAQGAGLELAAEHVPGVVRYFKMIAGMAELVNEFPLDDTAEHGAIFTPCPAPPRE